MNDSLVVPTIWDKLYRSILKRGMSVFGLFLFVHSFMAYSHCVCNIHSKTYHTPCSHDFTIPIHIVLCNGTSQKCLLLWFGGQLWGGVSQSKHHIVYITRLDIYTSRGRLQLLCMLVNMPVIDTVLSWCWFSNHIKQTRYVHIDRQKSWNVVRLVLLQQRLLNFVSSMFI